MTNAKTPGSGTIVRLVGTYDDTGVLLFSQGYKNFKNKDSCTYCHEKKPMMHHYAMAKKGERLTFSETSYCSANCFRKRDKSPYKETP